MVKKGIESNMVGKKKKETGQIDIYIYIYILCPTKSVHDLIV